MKNTLWYARAAVLAALPFALAACVSKKDFEKVQAENKTLVEEKQRSQRELGAAGAATQEMQATLDEVQKGLEDLRIKELKVVRTSIAMAQEGKTVPGQREALKAEIEDIRKAVRANLDKLATLQKQKNASDQKVTTLERLVSQLRKELEEKEATIAALEEKTLMMAKETEELRGTVKEKEAAVKEKEAAIADRETQLSTAYVLIATQSVLKKAGLVEKKGSVLGLGGNWQRTGHFDETLFKAIDTRKESEFAVAAGEKASTLTVTDSARFWKGSRYLVVMLPD